MTLRLIIRWSPQWSFRFSSAWQDRLRCAIFGHDDEIMVGERLMALHCRRCQWRSAGWHLDARIRRPLQHERARSAAPRVPIGLHARATQ